MQEIFVEFYTETARFLCYLRHCLVRRHNAYYELNQRRQSGLKSGAAWLRVKKSIFPGKFPKNFNFTKNFDFSKQISEKCQFHKKFRFFQPNFRKISVFAGNFTKNFDFIGKNWPFTPASGQIFLLLFKSHHFLR